MFNKNNFILNASVCFSRLKIANNLAIRTRKSQTVKSKNTERIRSMDPTFQLEYDGHYTVDLAHVSENTSWFTGGENG